MTPVTLGISYHRSLTHVTNLMVSLEYIFLVYAKLIDPKLDTRTKLIVDRFGSQKGEQIVDYVITLTIDNRLIREDDTPGI